MFFTPLYGVRNTGSDVTKLTNKFFLGVIEAFSAPQDAQCLKSQMCDFLVEIAIS
jgi:hypothetical protein